MKDRVKRLVCRVRGHRFEFLESANQWPCVVVCDRCMTLGQAELLTWAPNDVVEDDESQR